MKYKVTLEIRLPDNISMLNQVIGMLSYESRLLNRIEDVLAEYSVKDLESELEK